MGRLANREHKQILAEPEQNDALENAARDYARVGWSVTSRTVNALTLAKDNQTVRITREPSGVVRTEGPPPAIFNLEGRVRAWITLLVLLIAVFAVAWALGVFR